MHRSSASTADRGRPEPLATGPVGVAVAVLRRLEEARSTVALTLALLPVMVLLLLPTGWHPNEYHYFMLAFRRVAPEAFSPYSAAFDGSDARVLSELLMGGMIAWLDYETAQIVLRLLMAGFYAASLAWLLAGHGRSALEALLVVAVFILVGPDLMGGEWLFQGVESKTFAYALVFLGLGFLCRHRRWPAILALVAATYLHFLVGGFWFLAGLGWDVLHRREIRSSLRLLAGYTLAVLPLVLVLMVDHLIVRASLTVPAHGLSADYIYSVLRNPHHVAPFASPEQLGFWLGGILSTSALFLAFVLLARHATPAYRPMVVWVTLLLGYLLVALGLSWLDRETGHLGKFYLFRPSAVTLLLAILTLVILYGARIEGASSALPRVVRQLACAILTTIALLQVGERKLAEFDYQPPSDLVRAVDTLHAMSEPGDVVLIKAEHETLVPVVALPMMLDRPTLVSVKFVPTNARDIYRWYDLLRFRQSFFDGDCVSDHDIPVRYLLVSEPAADDSLPSCGTLVWRSPNFAIFALDAGDLNGKKDRK